MIFTLRQQQEKAIKQNQPLYIIFVYFSKASDTVDRETLWKVLNLYGCPEKVVLIIKLFHEGMTGAVRIAGDTGERFTINHGVKQGCVLANPLFSLSMCTNLNLGVFIKTRTDGKLFNLARLRAFTKTREICVTELLFADDSALVATDPNVIQEIADRLSCAARHFGMKINVSKPELLYQPPIQTTYMQ